MEGKLGLRKTLGFIHFTLQWVSSCLSIIGTWFPHTSGKHHFPWTSLGFQMLSSCSPLNISFAMLKRVRAHHFSTKIFYWKYFMLMLKVNIILQVTVLYVTHNGIFVFLTFCFKLHLKKWRDRNSHSICGMTHKHRFSPDFQSLQKWENPWDLRYIAGAVEHKRVVA